VIGPQTYGNPDANGNGIGLSGTEADQPYQMGAVMDAVIASGAANLVARTGGVNVRGRRYLDLVQDMADMYAWGQQETGSGRGGWRYSWHGGSDNSAAQWGAIGLIPAERIWGITIPAYVKTENKVWLDASYQSGTTSQCGFGYSGPGHTLEQTPSGLVQLAFQGSPRSATQWSCSEAHMDNTWSQFLTANTTYGYYAFTKAMRLATPPVVNLSPSGRNWFDAEPDGLRRTLVNRQRTDGSWLSSHSLPSEPVMNTAWTTIILTPTLFENPPVAIVHASPNPGAIGQAVRFDGSQSYHIDPFRRVVTYAWDFDASDGVDWSRPDAVGPTPSRAFGTLRSYTVSLRVGDDQDPQNFDVATATIHITIPPHPPTSVPGGPYVAAVGEPVALDGTGSFDIDAAQGDSITRFGWETDFQNPRDFDDALGARPTGVSFPSAGTFNVGLRVTDNTTRAFPQAGSPDLTHDAYTTVQVHNRCLENLSARAKTNTVALTWTHDGSSRYTIRRSTVSPSYGFTDIGTTNSAYSTFLDHNLENGRTYYYRVISANNCASHAVMIVPRFRSTNRRPVFTSTPVTTAQEAQAYLFDANATDPDGQTLTYWLDDGPVGMTINQTSGVVNWTPTRNQVGTHSVAIRAQDPVDMAAVQAFIVTVSPRPNLPPQVTVSGPAQGLSGQSLTFDGTGSTDPEGDTPLTFAWSFGDGETAIGPSVNHTFGASGTYVVTLFATDDRGATGTGTKTVVVNNPNGIPVARAGGPYQGPAGDPIVLDGSASSDPDNDSLTFTWNFGDNTGAFLGKTVSHTYAAEGTYQASLEVNDGRGGVAGAVTTVLVTAANRAPIATIVPGATFINPGDEILFDGAGSFDADGDALALTWSFGDGGQTSGDIVTHVFNSPGRFEVILSADDQRGKIGADTVSIHVNAPPVFQNPGPLAVQEDTPFHFPLAAVDADNHAITFSLLQGPTGLTVQNGPGSLFWVPTNADVGSHAVRLRASDGLGGSTEMQFQLTVINVNDAPEITSAPLLQATELNAYLYGPTATDVDVGDAVTWFLSDAPAGMVVNPISGLISWTPTHDQIGIHNVTLVAFDTSGAQDAQAFAVTVLELPWAPEFTSVPPTSATEDQLFEYQATARDLNAADTLVFSLVSGPTGLVVQGSTGLVSWTPLNEHVGNQTVRLRVSDGALTSDQEFILNVVNTNDAPVITSSPLRVAVTGEPYSYAVIASDPDVGDVLVFQLEQGSGDAAIQASSGVLSWLPTEAEVGDHPFRIAVRDAAGATTIQEFTVRVQRTPEPPAFTSTPPTSATQGQLYAYSATASDPNDDALAFALVSGPAGLSVSPSGLVQFIPGPSQVGDLTVRISVTDSRFTVEQAFTLQVANVNDNPVITSAPPVTGTDGITYTYQVLATDADGDPLTFALEQSPPGMTVSPTGLVQWPDDGNRPLQSDVSLRVSDGQGGFYLLQWSVEIVPDNVAPNVDILLSGNPVAPGRFVTITVVAADNVGVASRSLTIDGVQVNLTSGQYQYEAAGIGDVLLEATAIDANGNVGAASKTLTVSNSEDAEAPQVNLTFGPPNPRVGDLVQFTIGTTDAGGIDPERTWLLVDGQYLPVVNGRAEFRVSKNGSYTAIATAYDLNGNYGEAKVVFNASIAGSDNLPPAAEIVSPIDDSEVLSLVEIIGTATDANFAYYTLSHSDRNNIHWTEYFRSSAPVANGRLGQIDGTLLESGDYYVRLTVYDRYGNSASDQVQVHVNGQSKLGQFTLQFTDLKIAMPGLDLAVIRTYDSRDKSKGEFGAGWKLSFSSIKVNENRRAGDGWTFRDVGGFLPHFIIEPTKEHSVSVTLPGGRKQEFEVQAEFDNPMFDTRFGTFSFKAKAGTYSTLEPLGGNEFIRQGDQLLDWDFNDLDPNDFRLTFSDGTYFIIDQASGGVVETGDANGNRSTLLPNGITHSNGASFQFIRDSQNRITSIRDQAGRAYGYDYDGHGNLKSVTDPEGNQTRFKYAPNHYLQDILDPRGVRANRSEYDDQGRLVRQIGPDGKETSLDHDPIGRTQTVTDQEGKVTVLEYNALGRIERKTEEGGRVWNYTHDSNGNLTSTRGPDGAVTYSSWDSQGNETSNTDALGHVTQRVFGPKNKVTQETDPLGRVTRYNYDSRGNTLGFTGPDGVVQEAKTYDAQGNTLTSTDALGGVTSFVYNANGHMLSKRDPQGRTWQWTRDARGNALSETDPQGNVTRYQYDKNDNPIRVEEPSGKILVTAYNRIGKPLSETDGNGNVTLHEYNMYGDLTRTVYPDGSARTWEYNGRGALVSETDELGRKTQYTYDQDDRPLRTVYPDGTITSNEYDLEGRRIATVDALGRRTEFAYDAAGRLILSRDALGNEIRYTLNAAGNPVSMTDALGRRTEYEYDAYDRVIRTTFPGGSTKSTVFDANGRKISETDQAGATITYAYDAVGNLVQVQDPLGKSTRYTYDSRGRRITQRDALDRVTRFEYDASGRMIRKILPLGSAETYEYDGQGNRTSRVDYSGRRTSYAYDSRNRLSQIDYPAGQSDVLLRYTPTGRLESVTDGLGQTRFEYDARDRLTHRRNPNGKTLVYAYDAVGNRTSLTTPAGQTRFTFDPLNRLTEVEAQDGSTTTLQYDAVGNRSRQINANNTETRYSYDNLNRLTTLQILRGTTLLEQYQYDLGPAGNRLRVVQSSGRTVQYSYDAAYRLLGETVIDPQGQDTSLAYTYDDVGNRISLSRNGTTQALSYDDNDRLLSGDGKTYTYDANGNLATMSDAQGTTVYTFDAENRMVGVSGPGGTFGYQYDHEGNRASVTAGSSITEFLVDANRDLAQVLAEYDGSGNLSVEYLHGDDLLRQTRVGVHSYFHFDGYGSTRFLTAQDGTITDRYDFEAFGGLLAKSGTTQNVYLFNGQQYDPNVGFYYLRARYYDPSTGRFLSQDPEVGSPFEPFSLHKYVYAYGNPVNLMDPSGRFISVAFSFCIGSVQRGYSAAAGFLVLTSARLLNVVVGGVGFFVARGQQALQVFQRAGQQGINAWQTAFLRMHSSISVVESRAAAAFDRVAINRLLMGNGGNNPANIQWHHIVEQWSTNLTRFGPRAIHSIANVVPTPTHVHRVISGFYSSHHAWLPQGFTRFRDWMATLPWERQYQIGVEIWKEAMVTGRITWIP
jgi:RHS repeat-associated protein